MKIDEIIKEIKTLTEDELNDIRSALDKESIYKKEEELREVIKGHQSYVGKCYKKKVEPHSGMFPEMWRYYKVISERSENEFWMQVLVFDEHPTYWFEYQAHRIHNTGDYYLGEFEFDGIHIDNYPFFCYAMSVSGKKKEIDLLTEISIKEYNEAMDDYIKELKDITWYADHWRFGGKLPTDPMWKKEEK